MSYASARRNSTLILLCAFLLYGCHQHQRLVAVEDDHAKQASQTRQNAEQAQRENSKLRISRPLSSTSINQGDKQDVKSPQREDLERTTYKLAISPDSGSKGSDAITSAVSTEGIPVFVTQEKEIDHGKKRLGSDDESTSALEPLPKKMKTVDSARMKTA